MTDNTSIRPTSNILKNNSQAEEKTNSTRPISNINPNLKPSNESAYCFEFLTVQVCDENSINTQNDAD